MNILITGGASGLGEAITRELAKNPSDKIYFTFHSSVEKAQQLQSELANTTAFKCDFTKPEEVNLLKEAIKNWQLDTLINNYYSGEAIKKHFNKIPLTDFLDDFRDSVLPTIDITQAAINLFRTKKSGKIITVLTSFLLNTPPTGAAIYVANKAYLEKLTKVWASENSKYNISSNAISPAFMLTALNKDVDERIIEQIRENHPLKKILTVDEVAEAVGFLIKSSSQINGVNLVMNAGVNVK